MTFFLRKFLPKSQNILCFFPDFKIFLPNAQNREFSCETQRHSDRKKKNYNTYFNINNTDICLFNHKIQQGLGNQIVFFALGKKVYISNTTTPFSYYKDMGLDIYATENVKNMNFNEFSKKINSKNNRKLIFEDIDEKNIKKEWENVFK